MESDIKRKFGLVWPAHVGNLTRLLIAARAGLRRRPRHVPGFWPSSVTAPSRPACGSRADLRSLADGWRTARCDGRHQHPLNRRFQRHSRETVRRKLAQLMDKGWVVRGDHNALAATLKARNELAPLTEESLPVPHTDVPSVRGRSRPAAACSRVNAPYRAAPALMLDPNWGHMPVYVSAEACPSSTLSQPDVENDGVQPSGNEVEDRQALSLFLACNGGGRSAVSPFQTLLTGAPCPELRRQSGLSQPADRDRLLRDHQSDGDKAYNDRVTDGFRRLPSPLYPANSSTRTAQPFAIARARRSPQVENVTYEYSLGGRAVWTSLSGSPLPRAPASRPATAICSPATLRPAGSLRPRRDLCEGKIRGPVALVRQ